MLLRTGLLIFIIITVLSCKSGLWFEKQYEIPNEQWKYDNVLAYEIEANDTTNQHNIDLEVEYNENDFGFQNLYVNIKTTFPDKKITNQVVSLEILGDEAQMARKCSGTKCTVTVLLLGNFKFKQPGKYTIEISQFSREENLKGISKLGLSVITNDPS